jgi:hypothetical protein
MVSPTTARHGLHDLRDRIELLISDGPALGIESTIIACLTGAPGRPPPSLPHDGSPGTGHAVLPSRAADAAAAPDHAARRRCGGDAQPSGDLVEASANLFYHLRSLDGHAARPIAVAPIPESGRRGDERPAARRGVSRDSRPASQHRRVCAGEQQGDLLLALAEREPEVLAVEFKQFGRIEADRCDFAENIRTPTAFSTGGAFNLPLAVDP